MIVFVFWMMNLYNKNKWIEKRWIADDDMSDDVYKSVYEMTKTGKQETAIFV